MSILTGNTVQCTCRRAYKCTAQRMQMLTQTYKRKEDFVILKYDVLQAPTLRRNLVPSFSEKSNVILITNIPIYTARSPRRQDRCDTVVGLPLAANLCTDIVFSQFCTMLADL